ncbi:hypothetical protein C0993_003381, partial [Termitomyces sp. T159_Od127]
MTLLTPPPSAKKVSGISASILADDNSTAVTSSTSAPICEDLLPTNALETNSESSSSLYDSIWANELIEATAENVVSPALLVVEEESGIQSSIWATVADVNEVVELP